MTSDSTQLIAELQDRLATVADDRRRQWWERYLKSVIGFRGVATAEIRSAVHAWHEEHDLDGRADGDSFGLALDLMRQDLTEDKIAGMILLQELMIPQGRIGWRDALPPIAAILDDGFIYDWNACDWLCVRVLGPLTERDGEPCARAIAAWSTADNLWRRRASGVAFVNLARRDPELFPGFRDLVFEVCTATVAHPERFSQTGTGWVLRELSKVEPDQVAAFVTDHLGSMSREGVRYATAKLERSERDRILDAHRSL